MPTIAHIYIYGDIVSLQAPSLGHAGAVSLTSVKDAYNSNSTCDEVVVHIHSNGGSVFEGFAIHDFLVNTGKKITTIVEGLCCSIATVIFMAGTERKLTENSRFLIHNPWGNGEGDAAYFRRYANDLEDEQSRLLNFYKQHTGASLPLLQSYMTAEKLMSPELAVELHFATGIIDTVKAMALYRNPSHNPYQQPPTAPNVSDFPPREGGANPIVTQQTQQTQHMDKTKKSRFSQLINGLKNLVKDFNNETPDAQAAVKTLADNAGDLYFDGDLADGTAVFSDMDMTTPATDGDYEFEDGTCITIAAGLVTSVTQPATRTGVNNDPAGQAVLASLRKKLVDLKAEKQELETALAESETVMASASKALQLARSTYRPEKRENKFNRAAKPAGPELADKMEARKAELKARKMKRESQS